MSTNQRSLDEALLAYAEAWNTPDAAKRRDLLDKGLTDDCTYTDPAYEVRGREELVEHIGRSLKGEAYDGLGVGARIPFSSGADEHHGVFRFTWVLVGPQGQVLLEGMDFVELADDGRLRRITGFFGAFPLVPEDWPDHLVWRVQ